MEIEIVTTKKKLTKSIIKQISEVSFDELRLCKIMGYVNSADLYNSRIIILKYGTSEYRKAYCNWNLGKEKLYRSLDGNWNQVKKFEDEDTCNKYYDTIVRFKNQATQIYI